VAEEELWRRGSPEQGGQSVDASAADATPDPLTGPEVHKRIYNTAQRRAYSIRFSKEEWKQILAAAKTTGYTPAGFVALSAVAASESALAARSGVVDQRALVRELMRATGQLSQVGNNLNQVAHQLNMGGPVPPALQALIERVATAVDHVERSALLLVRQG
jgi:uncharacterized protein (DUF1778 family)